MAIISSIISVYFYIGLIVKMYFTEPNEESQMGGETGLAGITLILSSAAVVLLGLLPTGLLNVMKLLFVH